MSAINRVGMTLRKKKTVAHLSIKRKQCNKNQEIAINISLSIAIACDSILHFDRNQWVYSANLSYRQRKRLCFQCIHSQLFLLIVLSMANKWECVGDFHFVFFLFGCCGIVWKSERERRKSYLLKITYTTVVITKDKFHRFTTQIWFANWHCVRSPPSSSSSSFRCGLNGTGGFSHGSHKCPQ